MACSVETETRRDTFVVDIPARLLAQTKNGTITVVASGTSVIQVTATIRNPSRVSYRVAQRDDTVGVAATTRSGFRFFQGHGGADLQVVVPVETDLGLAAQNGDISVTGATTGQARLIASNGSINLKQVHLLGFQGSIDLETSDGPVAVDGGSGYLVIRARNGGVQVRDFVGQVKAQAGNASIDFQGRLLAGTKNSLRASNGSVRVNLGDTPGVEVDAWARNGRVETRLPLTATVEQGPGRLVGSLGSGGGALEIQTTNGSIAIR